jgi:glutamyl/glutaminyl-tRNA synthetase
MAVTRFAPSPTGYLHVGGARIALFDLLWARKTGGKFILRIEDTDQSRNSPTAAEQVMADLKWLGLQWDFGPNLGGPAEPYYQSQRRDIYDKYINQLISQGKAYYCFDSAEEIEMMRQKASAEKKNFIYRRPEKFPDSAQAAAARAQGKSVVVRFCIGNEEIIVNDVIRGEVKFEGSQISDFIIQKNDGFPTYHFACVIDDELMGVDCVIRGQEHLMNTPGHIMLQKSLGFKTPLYAHLPVTVNESGGKMSKRDRAKVLKQAIKTKPDIDIDSIARAAGITKQEIDDFLKGDTTPDTPAVDAMAEFLNIELPEVNIIDFFKSGYLPQALINFIALLGYSPGLDKEILTLDKLIESFDPKRFSKTNSLFDRKKLLAFNTEHIKMLSDAELLSRYKDFLKGTNSIAANTDDKLLSRILKAAAGARTLAEIEHKSRFIFTAAENIEYDKKDVEKVLLKNTGEGLAMLGELKTRLSALPKVSAQSIEEMLRGLAEEKHLGLGKVAQPLRVAICGTTISLPIFESVDILGIEETIKRIDKAVAKFSSNIMKE